MPANRSIVLIDDDQTTNALNTLIIERAELVDEIITFEQADKALEFFKEERESEYLILLDINMPIMNGWEFLQEFSKTKQNGVHIVLLTSSIDPTDISKAKKFELVLDFKSKPLSIEMLTNLVGQYLN